MEGNLCVGAPAVVHGCWCAWRDGGSVLGERGGALVVAGVERPARLDAEVLQDEFLVLEDRGLVAPDRIEVDGDLAELAQDGVQEADSPLDELQQRRECVLDELLLLVGEDIRIRQERRKDVTEQQAQEEPAADHHDAADEASGQGCRVHVAVADREDGNQGPPERCDDALLLEDAVQERTDHLVDEDVHQQSPG